VVAGENGGITGFGIMFYASEDAHLLLFAVRRAHQRRGIGSAILRWLEDVARAAGANRIRVECTRENSAGRNFYAEHGYHELSITTRMYRGVKDGVHLEKWFRESA
jgi:ribosomal-protein-alanine N-acetyltransferase